MSIKCIMCKDNKGFILLNTHGDNGSYYALTCKVCGWQNSSEIMGKCNRSHMGGHNTHTDKSNDGRYWVYSEDYARSVIKEGR